MVEVLKKTIHQMGGSCGTITPKKFMDKNNLKLGSKVEIIVNDDYILTKACDDPFMNDLLHIEIEALERLSKIRKNKIEQTKVLVEHASKELDEGGGELQ